MPGPPARAHDESRGTLEAFLHELEAAGDLTEDQHLTLERLYWELGLEDQVSAYLDAQTQAGRMSVETADYVRTLLHLEHGGSTFAPAPTSYTGNGNVVLLGPYTTVATNVAATSCPSDCAGLQGGKPGGRFCCGFGGENPVGCGDPACTSGGFDCTETPQGGSVTTCCGDFAFEAPEDGFNCSLDCGAPPVCGDLTCEAGEDVCSCAQDCGSPPADEVGSCSDGEDNDCDGDTDCADADCAGDAACQVVDCSSFTDKNSCAAEPSCHWSNQAKVCLPN